jgi:BirA family biotin operon repressor/biotin-[acetyl-CoA-carboxylase] ligase
MGTARATGGFWRVRRVAATGSTNDDLVAAARAGEPAGAVLVAGFQTAGRGRQGRRWEAVPGAALLVSVLLRPGPSAARWPHGATQAAGLAARDACDAVAGVAVDLKWPNDLVVEDRKLAGVLAEGIADAAGLAAVVVGLGLNLTGPLQDGLGAVALDELAGHAVDGDAVLDAYLARLAVHVQAWENEPDTLRDAYRHALGTLGRAVRVRVPDGEDVTGTASDVTSVGALVVRTEAGAVVIEAGDVVHLRPA